MPNFKTFIRDQRRRQEETYADPEARAEREAEATAWTPRTDSDYRADAGTRAASTGELYDPTQNSATRYDAIANGGNNLANYQNRTMQVLNRGMGDYTARDAAAAGSRGAADAWMTGGRPTYDAPTYTAPGEFTWDEEAPELESDEDIGARFSYYDNLLDPGGRLGMQGLDYEPERVGDYGAAFNTWLEGAQGQFGSVLGEQLRRLNEGAAARGRLRSGFYDEDVGLLSRQLAGDFSNQAKMAALDAARLGLEGASGNADRALEAARLKRGWAETAYGNRSNLLADAMGRSEYLDTARRGAWESDRDFGYDAYRDSRDFGRGTFEDDRNFGYGAYRDSTRDWENDRDFLEDRYRFDEGEADDARDFYADWLSGAYDRRTDMTRYQDAQPSWIEKAAGVVTPIAGMALDAFAPGAGRVATAVTQGATQGGGYAPTPRTTLDTSGFPESLDDDYESYYQRRWG